MTDNASRSAHAITANTFARRRPRSDGGIGTPVKGSAENVAAMRLQIGLDEVRLHHEIWSMGEAGLHQNTPVFEAQPAQSGAI
ncbi:hypothetical protein [Mesorhizobium sp. M1348]|uniref:hypothetical protein n=1 Tax=Mesorhizobium sp. M1348 TaxID=2957089 RepID=UPI003335270C